MHFWRLLFPSVSKIIFAFAFSFLFFHTLKDSASWRHLRVCRQRYLSHASTAPGASGSYILRKMSWANSSMAHFTEFSNHALESLFGDMYRYSPA